MPFPERIETSRLVLRRWQPSDRAAIAAVWSDPDVWASLMPGRPFDAAFADERFERQLEHWSEHGFGLLVIEDAPSPQVAGWVGPAHPTFVPQLAAEVELGWTLRRPYWGRGLATEAAAAAARAAFTELDVARLISLIDRGNHRSAAVAGRLAMRRVQSARHPGLGIDLDVYELIVS